MIVKYKKERDCTRFRGDETREGNFDELQLEIIE